MADVVPFRALRPKAEYAARVSTLPYDVYTEEEARAVLSKNPFSFLTVIRPEAALNSSMSYDQDKLYAKARQALYSYIQKGIFFQDKAACFYIYRLTDHIRSYTGIVGLASVKDYVSGCIRGHENTHTEKEADRTRHIEVCQAQTGPVFMVYHTDPVLKELITDSLRQIPVYDFIAEDGVHHQVWSVSDPMSIKRIQTCFACHDSIYIADGHHRCAAAVKAALNLKQNKTHTKYDIRQEAFYILSVFFQEDELTIMEYNRVTDTLGGYDEETFLKCVSERFLVKKINEAQKPPCKGQITMYLKSGWYLLYIPRSYHTGDPVRDLDTSVLQEQLLEPILHIRSIKTDTHMDFVAGSKSLEELERRVHTDMRAAFALYPVDIRELFSVADHGLLMPPKSTWFEPKLRSGLFIHTIK